MDPRIKIFYICAKQKSFTKAAQILNMTQPAITFQIKNLEKEFKTNLFSRDINQIQLTYPGKILLKHAERILTEYEKAKKEIYDVTGKLVGEIRIGIATVFGTYLLPKSIGQFKQKYSDVDVQMLVGNSAMLIDELKKHSIDVAIVSEPITDQRFVIKSFVEDELIIIVNQSHAWAEKGTVDLEELITEPFVDRERGSGSRATYKNFFDDKGISLKKFNVVMTMGNVEAVKSFVESGTCYGIASKIAVRREIEAGILKHINIRGESIDRNFIIAYHPQSYNNHLISAFLNTVLSEITAPG